MSTQALTRRIREQRTVAEDIRTCYSAVVSYVTGGETFVKSDWKDGGVQNHRVQVLLPTYQEMIDPQGGNNGVVSNVVRGATVLIQEDQEGQMWITGVAG